MAGKGQPPFTLRRRLAQANWQSAAGRTEGVPVSAFDKSIREHGKQVTGHHRENVAPRATPNPAVHIPQRRCTGAPALPPKTHRRPITGKPTTGARRSRPAWAAA
ncbi:putative secreted protein [Xanthomonas citri pv. fuscans]|nr:putative secreted protein [Xanthomonas citri pv. fuscans]